MTDLHSLSCMSLAVPCLECEMGRAMLCLRVFRPGMARASGPCQLCRTVPAMSYCAAPLV